MRAAPQQQASDQPPEHESPGQNVRIEVVSDLPLSRRVSSLDSLMEEKKRVRTWAKLGIDRGGNRGTHCGGQG